MEFHESHTLVHTLSDQFDTQPDRYYCLDCEEWSWFVLAQPCRGNPHTGNIVLPEHLPKGAILRGQ